MSYINNLRAEEKAVFALRGLYESYGYNKYKVSQFEEYSFYLKYKSFLSGDKFLSFTDLDGRLMALKPDISLSIIKNAADTSALQKLYYHENVFRESQSTNTFCEISQMGLEYLGDINDYAVCETVLLAKRSLREISEKHVLELSHMGYVQGLFEALGIDNGEKESLLSFAGQKSEHEINSYCKKNGIPAHKAEKICELSSLSGSFDAVIQKARGLSQNSAMDSAVEQLVTVNEALNAAGEGGIRLDFTLLNDTEFYDGILIAGYIEGVPQAVLSGGRYNGMMQKLSKKGGAIGFAVYLSLLEYLREQGSRLADACIITNGESPAEILVQVQSLVHQGMSVLAVEKGQEALARQSFIITREGLQKC